MAHHLRHHYGKLSVAATSPALFKIILVSLLGIHLLHLINLTAIIALSQCNYGNSMGNN